MLFFYHYNIYYIQFSCLAQSHVCKTFHATTNHMIFYILLHYVYVRLLMLQSVICMQTFLCLTQSYLYQLIMFLSKICKTIIVYKKLLVQHLHFHTAYFVNTSGNTLFTYRCKVEFRQSHHDLVLLCLKKTTYPFKTVVQKTSNNNYN